MLKRVIRIMSIYILLAILMTGCSKDLDYATDKPFIIKSTSIAGPDTTKNFYPTIISLDMDGNVTLYSEPTKAIHMAEDRPMYETTISESELEQMKDLIEGNKFWKMKENISDYNSDDGSYSYMTVQLTNDSKTVGGLNTLNEQYLEIAAMLNSYVDEDERSKWQTAIEEHILAMNPEFE